jgi:mannose-6-phosphate isomerase-like protein (cupin superfamily)
MEIPRRELAMLLPLLAAHAADAQSKSLPAKTYRHEDLPVRDNANGNKGRAILDGESHTGYPVEIHETELAPGNMPHAAHKHEHIEVMLLREGTLEVTIDGVVSTLGPGSVAFLASNCFHGWKNVGSTRASYFVMALGRKRA